MRRKEIEKEARKKIETCKKRRNTPCIFVRYNLVWLMHEFDNVKLLA